MPEVTIKIGGRPFQVACQAGEEQFLQTAAAMLDGEAQALAEQAGRMPEAQLLLMAGLMLADKTAAMEDRLREAEARVTAPAERVEVPVVPQEVLDLMAELAARAEALADDVEEKTP